MQLFYTAEISDTEITLQAEEAEHCSRVLRKKEGDVLTVIDGQGSLYSARMAKVGRNSCILTILTKEFQERSSVDLHIACAPTKNIDRFEWFLEKATEIGVTTVTPMTCFNSERRQIRNDRLDKIILSASKQSLKYWFPVLEELISFDAFLKKSADFDGQKFIAHCHESEKEALKTCYQTNESALILIGPEGDFSKEEVAKAINLGFVPISLGQSRLRTETAALVAVHTVNLLNG